LCEYRTGDRCDSWILERLRQFTEPLSIDDTVVIGESNQRVRSGSQSGVAAPGEAAPLPGKDDVAVGSRILRRASFLHHHQLDLLSGVV